ncbi:hypothetical protein GGI42DRAFT_348039 [Trichoderma sp. SZMC 28013]
MTSRNLLPLSEILPRTSTTSSDQAEGVKSPLGLSFLYSPTAPEIDFIFAHGLGGNSGKTWSKSSLYGYDSYYLKGKEGCLNICKFDTPEDFNYALLRNALASIVSKISTAIPELKPKQRREKIKTLKKYLEVADVLDDDLAKVCEARMHGSCEWISAKASYVKWRDGVSGNDRTLWAKGKPATGKSVLAGHVID